MPVNDQVARITQSPPLVSSPSLCRFLRYIVAETLAGRASGIKEQVLGLEVFHRGQDFNPRLDPIVRVQARNLRSRMAKYYEGPGQADPIRIELPKGAYVPVFHQVGPIAEAPRGETARVAPELSPGPAEVHAAGVAPTSVSVMPSPPPRSPVVVNRQTRPRFLVAAMILVVILTGITVLWIARTHAAPGIGVKKDSPAQDLVMHGRYLSLRDKMHFKG
jgi:hypothetical protein